MEPSTAIDKPTKPYCSPSNAINTKSVTILTGADNPIRVDSFACSFAKKTEDIESGMIDKTRICKLNIPSEYFGKNSFTKKGAKMTAVNAIKADPRITK